MKRMMLAGAMVMLGGLSVRAGAQMDDPKFEPREEPAVEMPEAEARVIPLTALLEVDDEFAYRAESVVRQRVTTPAGVTAGEDTMPRMSIVAGTTSRKSYDHWSVPPRSYA